MGAAFLGRLGEGVGTVVRQVSAVQHRKQLRGSVDRDAGPIGVEVLVVGPDAQLELARQRQQLDVLGIADALGGLGHLVLILVRLVDDERKGLQAPVERLLIGAGLGGEVRDVLGHLHQRPGGRVQLDAAGGLEEALGLAADQGRKDGVGVNDEAGG